MDALVEWYFGFRINGPGPIPRPVADALMNEAIEWADARNSGVGGGYRPEPSAPVDESVARLVRVGLCGTEGGRSITRELADELVRVLRDRTERQGAEWCGGVRPLTPEEPASPPCQAPPGFWGEDE